MGDVRHELTVCNHCNGDGWTSEHDPLDPHENGCTNCPIQVQCEHCEATGLLWKKDIPTKIETVEDEDNEFSLPF